MRLTIKLTDAGMCRLDRLSRIDHFGGNDDSSVFYNGGISDRAASMQIDSRAVLMEIVDAYRAAKKWFIRDVQCPGSCSMLAEWGSEHYPVPEGWRPLSGFPVREREQAN